MKNDATSVRNAEAMIRLYRRANPALTRAEAIDLILSCDPMCKVDHAELPPEQRFKKRPRK